MVLMVDRQNLPKHRTENHLINSIHFQSNEKDKLSTLEKSPSL